MLFSSWFITGCGTDRLDNSTKGKEKIQPTPLVARWLVAMVRQTVIQPPHPTTAKAALPM